MEKIRSEIRQRKQKKYRRAQFSKGLVRYELQVHSESKDLFEEIVQTVADEMVEPTDERRRMAKARIRVFDEVMQGITHEFFTLKDQIKALQDEITALSPSFFKVDATDQPPLPNAVRALPDDPDYLKKLVTQFFQNAQAAIQTGKEHERRAKQYLELYEASQAENTRLRSLLSKHDISIEAEF